MIKKILFVLLIALLLTSCEVEKVNDVVQINFSTMRTKSINATYADSETATWEPSNVNVGNAEDYYWAYTAVKKDNGFTTGQATEFTPLEGKGLNQTLEFSTGSWTFTLRAFATEAERTVGEKYIFEGATDVQALSSTSTVSIPVDYSYVNGEGTVNISVTANINDTDSTITKVEALIGRTLIVLTSENGTLWQGKGTVPVGDKDVRLLFYVNNAETPIAQSADYLGEAVIVHGLTTDVTGVASITLDNEKSVTFSATLPSSQPDGTKYSGLITSSTDYDGYTKNIYANGAIEYTAKDGYWLVNNKDSVVSSISLDWNVNEEEFTVITDEDRYGVDDIYKNYQVGSTGPAGGYIFYDAGYTHTSEYLDENGETVTYKWRFLEACSDIRDINNFSADCKNSTIFGLYGTSETCSECNGNSTWEESCSICNGTGQIDCTTCNGAGVIQKTATEVCEACNGEGQIDNMVCETCDGAGQTTKTTTEDCTKCENGKCSCPITIKKTCSKCSGSGVITSKDYQLVGTKKEIGQGRYNTTLLINKMKDSAISGTNKITDTYAAKVASNYTKENNGVTYNDWFLPSIDELDKLLKNHTASNNWAFESKYFMFSSSESSKSSVYGKLIKYFYYGVSEIENSKAIHGYVIPIRAF